MRRRDGGDELRQIIEEAREMTANDSPPGSGVGTECPAVAPAAEQGATDQACVDDDEGIARLAALSALAYDRVRFDAAKQLNVRVAILDKLVHAARSAACDTTGQGRALELPSPEPYPHVVDGAALMDDLTAAVRRHVVMEDGAPESVALWVLAAHAIDAFNLFPRLGITSPEKRCGKTTLLDVLHCLVPRPLQSANITAAAIFRTIERVHPTLLIDEGDAFIPGDEAIRGVLNSGHSRSGSVIRLVGDDHEPRMFSTFCATVIAMIGRLPDTVEDRSIPVHLRRRRSDETITPLRADRTGNLTRLCSMAARWANDHVGALAEVDPAIPSSITNRDADNWRPLFAIADAAGAEWPDRARRIAETLVAGAGSDAGSLRVLLLEDIRNVFEGKKTDKLPSAQLVTALIELEGRPWGESQKGKPITQVSLARLLAPFSISPSSIRTGDSTPKGYERRAFDDAFSRYLRAEPQPRHNPSNPCLPTDSQSATPDSMLRIEKPPKPAEHKACGGVALENPLADDEPWESVL